MAKMSIHQALAELKLLDKRIKDAISKNIFVSFAIGKKPVRGYNDTKEFEERAKAAYQSITDLIKRRNKIKAAIVQSNANTKIRIGDVEMTVAEALERKQSIAYEQELLSKLIKDLNEAVTSVELENRSVQQRLDKLLEVSLGTDRKGKEEEAKAISENFLENNEAKLVDPIDVRKKIDELQKRIDDFLSQVDYRLSESNTVTMIEIDD